ncbi:DUF4238 domain-containing protein [Burkholderia pseudomallei]|nr:DUF4238 domain-containing protein [Burkholderia pseudomallei]
MPHNGIAKVQHYVSQFLLKISELGKRNISPVLNKLTEKTFVSAARNIAVESRFYDFKRGGKETHTVELILTKIESTAKPIFQKIVEADWLAELTPGDRANPSTFLLCSSCGPKRHAQQRTIWSVSF